MFSPLKGGTDFIMSHNVSFTTTSKKIGWGSGLKTICNLQLIFIYFFIKILLILLIKG